jgi:hypothetical protein
MFLVVSREAVDIACQHRVVRSRIYGEPSETNLKKNQQHLFSGNVRHAIPGNKHLMHPSIETINEPYIFHALGVRRDNTAVPREGIYIFRGTCVNNIILDSSIYFP